MRQLGPYQIIERIGAGGTAEVFRARREMAGISREVVVKRVHEHLSVQPEYLKMALIESRVAALLNHPNIVQLVEVTEIEGAHCLVLEYVDGTTLARVIDRASEMGMPLPVPPVLKICSLVCEALDYAHKLRDGQGRPLNFVHRDISPDNVLLGYNGAVKLADFGIARLEGVTARTKPGIMKGKVQYASPEQVCADPIDARTDIYSLGVLLYEALTGKRPFDAPDTVALMQKVLHEPPPDPRAFRSTLSPSLSKLVLRALEKDRDGRFQDARAMQEAIDALLLQAHQAVSGADVAKLLEKFAPRQSEEATVRAVSLEEVVAVGAPPAVPSDAAEGGTILVDRARVSDRVTAPERAAPAPDRRGPAVTAQVAAAAPPPGEQAPEVPAPAPPPAPEVPAPAPESRWRRSTLTVAVGIVLGAVAVVAMLLHLYGH